MHCPRIFCGLLLLISSVGVVMAAPPALREQLSLNGEWPVGGTVPTYAGIPKLDERIYERDVTVPATDAWRDRVVKIEFGAVNFIATVFVNDVRVGENVGGWCPFAVDVTRFAAPGQTFRLRVEVKGSQHPPITDSAGQVAWPVGAWRNLGGIADDVWLRAYGPVHLEDAFIQTSVARQRLTVDYTVTNASGTTRTIRVVGEAAGIALTSEPLTLLAGESRSVQLSAPAKGVELYWPDRPRLHVLDSRVIEAATEATLDRETRRFGFREIEVRGNQFFWNGVRANLYGDYQAFGDNWYLDSSRWHTPEAWPATVDKIKAMHIRVLRWHHNPVPKYLLEICDEKGLLVCEEAANYGRDFLKQSDRSRYLENALRTIAPWIRANRNHPSLYLWNATNEMTHSFVGFAPSSLVTLGREITRLDPTRPVGYDGDTGRSNAYQFSSREELTKNRIVDAQLVDYHYPEGYNREPAGSIYSWARLVFPDKPTGAGELLHTRSPDKKLQSIMERNTWWLGLWLRGLRYTDWTNVKPACWWFTESDLASADPAQRRRTLNLRNALAPVALFDKAYDDLGIEPYVTGLVPGGTLPELPAGDCQTRTLVLYNDEFHDPAIEVEVLVRSGGKTIAEGRTTVALEPGAHRDLPCTFQVPDTDGAEVSLVLRTYKQGELRFEEERKFLVHGRAAANAAAANRRADLVTFDLAGDARPSAGPTVTAGEREVYSFPAGYAPQPLNYSGLFQMEGKPVPPLMRHVGKTLTWRALNPAEGVYDFSYIDGQLRAAELGGYMVVFRLKASIYHASPAEEGQAGLAARTVPDWVVDKHALYPAHVFRTRDPSISGGDATKDYVSPWHPGVQTEFRHLLQEIGRRGYLENNACMGFYLHGISHSYGEEMDLYSTAYADNANAAAMASGFTGAIHGNPLADAIMDCWTKRITWWAEAAGPSINKVVFVNAGNMPGKPYPRDQLAAFSLAQGLGERHGNIEEYFYGDVLPDKQGQTYVPGGYVETDWDHPVRDGRYWGDENEQMNHYRMPGGGQPADEVRALCYRSSFFRAAQLGMNFLWTDASFANAAGNGDPANVADENDYLPAWFIRVAGKGPELSPDAICWLRQAWVRLLPGAGNEARPWNNLERFLLQRDIRADGPVIGAMTVPDLAMNFPYVSMKRRGAPDGPPETSDNEYTARRTDLASGNPHLAFKLAPAFKDSILRQHQAVQIRVHYLHNRHAPFTVRVARGGPAVIDLGTVSGEQPDGEWKTATFTLEPADFPVPGNVLGAGIDFVIRATGSEDLTVRYVRVVRTAEIPIAPIIRRPPQSKTANAGSSARFWVQAEGPGTLAYRWRKGTVELSDGAKYSGATTATLTIADMAASDEGDYSVIVGNRVGSTRETISQRATLTLGSAPAGRLAGH